MNQADSGNRIFANANNLIDTGFYLIYFFVFMAGMVLFVNFPPLLWVDLLTDDAYYYLGVARNIALHGVSSFLPPFETNGYQPLWLLLVSISAFIFGATTPQYLAIEIYTLDFICILLFVLQARRLHQLAFPALISVLSYANIVLYGMESALLPVLILNFFNATNWRLRGLFGALLFLGRLDALALVAARDCYVLLFKRRLEYQHYFIIVPVVLIYALINYYLFGVPVPVSGLQKAVGSVFAENISTGLNYFLTLKTALRLLAMLLLVLLLQKKSILQLRFLQQIVVLTAAGLICALYYGAKSGWPIWDWYYWASFMLIYYLLMESALFMKDLLAQPGKMKFAYMAMLVVSIAYTVKPTITLCNERLAQLSEAYGGGTQQETFGRKNLELVDFIHQQHIPPQRFFAMGDRAGSFGFFLGNDYRFFHAEGLVGDVNYYQAMRNDNALGFIDKLDINYWIADRENYFDGGNVIGVLEPVQGLSMHQGAYLICFDKKAVLLDQSYVPAKYQKSQQHEYRYLFDYAGRVDCPQDMQAKFAELRNRYAGLRAFSLPVEMGVADFHGRNIIN